MTMGRELFSLSVEQSPPGQGQGQGQGKVIDLPLRVTKVPSTYSYTIQSGHQPSVDSPERVKFFHASAGTRVFHGHCYHCGCMKHSQNYCPLKSCQICAKYGHDQRVCYFNTDRTGRIRTSGAAHGTFDTGAMETKALDTVAIETKALAVDTVAVTHPPVVRL
jgi:hypothetical protein